MTVSFFILGLLVLTALICCCCCKKCCTKKNRQKSSKILSEKSPPEPSSQQTIISSTSYVDPSEKVQKNWGGLYTVSAKMSAKVGDISNRYMNNICFFFLLRFLLLKHINTVESLYVLMTKYV